MVGLEKRALSTPRVLCLSYSRSSSFAGFLTYVRSLGCQTLTVYEIHVPFLPRRLLRSPHPPLRPASYGPAVCVPNAPMVPLVVSVGIL